MGIVPKVYTFSPGNVILSAEHNKNFDDIFNLANGALDNANIAAGANIAMSKINLGSDATFTGDINFTSSATTDDVITVTASSLTTGSALKVYSNSTDTGVRNLVEIINDNAAADAATLLQLQQDGDAAHINMTGDSGNTTPVDGDIWYDGTDIKAYDGTNTLIVAGLGQVVQVVNVMDGAEAHGTNAFAVSAGIPVNTDGDEYMTLAITPKATTNKLKIDVVVNGSTSGATGPSVALFQDVTANALAAVYTPQDQNAYLNCISFTHYMDAGTTSATTFKVRAGGSAGTFTFNGASSTVVFGGVMASSITITEIAA